MNIALVASKGGHLGQMKLIFTEKVLEGNRAILVTEDFFKKGLVPRAFLRIFPAFYFAPDVLKLNPFKYLKTLIAMIGLFKRERVEAIVTNGAQLSIPAVIAGKLLSIPVVFMDTIIRVKTPNWSARFCYIFADRFLVQHREMMHKYGKKSEYWGGVL